MVEVFTGMEPRPLLGTKLNALLERVIALEAALAAKTGDEKATKKVVKKDAAE